jgi:hypothetical protein
VIAYRDALAAAAKVTWQLAVPAPPLAASMQVGPGANDPDVAALNVTVPVGAVLVPASLSATFSVQVTRRAAPVLAEQVSVAVTVRVVTVTVMVLRPMSYVASPP